MIGYKMASMLCMHRQSNTAARARSRHRETGIEVEVAAHPLDRFTQRGPDAHAAHGRSQTDTSSQRLSNSPQRAPSRTQEAWAINPKHPNANVPCALQTAQGTSGITGIRNRKAKRTALSKAERLPTQLPANLANDGVDEGGLGHLELASRHERDGQGNKPTRHDIR